MNIELANISNWFGTNKPSVNLKKTNCMLICSGYTFQEDNKLLLMHKSEEIIQVNEFKYLGVIIDETLNFNVHVNKSKSKVNPRTGLLWRIRNSIPFELAKDLYGSLIETHFVYCSCIYDACSLDLKRQ